jgi:WhiB family transcriptional regulator, redox-sensing transcriptional regulator
MIEGTIIMPDYYAHQHWSGSRPGYSVAYVPAPQWDDTAACRSHDLSEFFAPDYEYGELTQVERTYVTGKIRRQYERAREVCRSCPFLDHCSEYAIAHEAEGVWGATSPQQRDRIRRDRKWINVETHDIPAVFSTENVAEYQHDTGGTDEEAA